MTSSRSPQSHVPARDRVAEACRRLAAGGVAIVTPVAAGREAPSMAMAAEAATEASVAFMTRSACGVVRLALEGRDCARLGLRPQPGARHPGACDREEMLVSIEARAGVSTGISAADRATTLRAAGAPGATAAELVSPGHVVPVRAARGGVLQRPGVAEAAVALCRLAERPGGAVLCHVLDDEGEAASDACVARLARRHGLAVVSVAEVVASVAADELEWLPVPA